MVNFLTAPLPLSLTSAVPKRIAFDAKDFWVGAGQDRRRLIFLCAAVIIDGNANWIFKFTSLFALPIDTQKCRKRKNAGRKRAKDSLGISHFYPGFMENYQGQPKSSIYQ